jgi:hypothetical protein
MKRGEAQKYEKKCLFLRKFLTLGLNRLTMDADTLVAMDTTTQRVRPLCTDSTMAMAQEWNYSSDSALYHGSGFWFEDVLQYFKQRDSFGFIRHDAVLRSNRMMSESLLLGLLLFEVFLIGFLLKRGLKLINQYTRISFMPVDKGASTRDSIQTGGFSQLLWTLSLIVFSLMSHVLLNAGLGYHNYQLGSWQIVNLFLYTFIFFFLRTLSYRLIGWIFFSSPQVERWISNDKTLLFCFAMVLTPVLIGAEIGSITNATFILYYTTIALILTKIWMLFKTVRIFSVGKADFLYLILYLCALEIMPILLYYRGLFLV